MAYCHPQVEFEKEIYFPGEEVTGKAWVSTGKNMKAKKVEITFSGKSVTAWTNVRKAVEDKIGKKGEETYVEMKHEVWTPDDENNTFPAGDYEWNFSFELPKDCPPSFEGKFGFIRYSVLLHMDIPNWPEKNVERAVTVSPIIDLNVIAGAQNPARLHLDNAAYYSACMPCLPTRGKISYTMTSPKLGYVPGETIIISGQIENGTSKPMRIIEAKLNRKITYREELKEKSKSKRKDPETADGFKSKIVNEILETKIERCNVAPRTNKDFGFSFVIPPVVSTIRNSKFITVEYYVTIWGDTGLFNRGASASLNIIVGNIPSDGIALPTRKFVEGNAAQCWTIHLKKYNFTTQVPYYGN